MRPLSPLPPVKISNGSFGSVTTMRELLFASPGQALLLFLTFVGRTSALSQDAACYSPNGVIAGGNYPCFLDQEQSACCGSGTICEASGLCKVEGSVGVSDLIRGTCTDSTWASSECPLYCTGQQFSHNSWRWDRVNNPCRCGYWRNEPHKLPECDGQRPRFLLRSYEWVL